MTFNSGFMDIRWIQRFDNYKKALLKLQDAVEKFNTKSLNEIEIEGLIQRFEYTYELAWNTIKDFYQNQGEVNIQGSRDAFKTAFAIGLINKGEIWMAMIESRKLTVHTYDEKMAQAILNSIVSDYFPVLNDLKVKLTAYL